MATIVADMGFDPEVFGVSRHVTRRPERSDAYDRQKGTAAGRLTLIIKSELPAAVFFLAWHFDAAP